MKQLSMRTWWCSVQLACVLILLIFGISYAPVAFEWNRLSNEARPDYIETARIIREEGISEERRELAARLFHREFLALGVSA